MIDLWVKKKKKKKKTSSYVLLSFFGDFDNIPVFDLACLFIYFSQQAGRPSLQNNVFSLGLLLNTISGLCVTNSLNHFLRYYRFFFILVELVN